MKKALVLASVIIGSMAVSAVASAQIIGIQFSENNNPLSSSTSAGVVPSDNFNVVTGNGTGITLNDSTGSLTTATLSVSSGGYFTNNSFPAGGDRTLLSSGLNSAGGGSLSLNNIPYATYNVIIYGVSDNGSNNNGNAATAGLTTTYKLTPAGGTAEYLSLQPVTNSSSYIQSTSTFNGVGAPPTTGFTANANYVEFTGLTASDLSLNFSGVNASGGGFNAALNGIQIVNEGAAVPEPSTWAIMLGGLGLLCWSFRQRRA